MLENLILIFHVLAAAAMIGLILLQQGKGAEMGASFGSGSSQTVFGAAGSASFLTKLTWGLAIFFFSTSLILAYIAHTHVQAAGTTIPGLDVPTAPATSGKLLGDVPAAPAAPVKLGAAPAGDVPAPAPKVAAAPAPAPVTAAASGK
jgi:preprotein translocase subunit SecG